MGDPITKEEFISRHSAYFQGIGFDEQFAGCMRYMLSLGMSDTIYYEHEDDFVIDRESNGKTIREYYQVKYSSDSNARMTDSSDDFWKTISNWIGLYNLSDSKDKNNFFVNGRFGLLTNKEVCNKYYELIVKLRNGLIQINDVKKTLNEAEKSSPSYVDVIKEMLKLGNNLLNQFLHKVEVIRFDNFYGAMYDQFLLTYHRPSVADAVLKDLVGELVVYKKDCGGKFQFTGETFSQTFKGTLQKIACSDTLTLELETEPDLDSENIEDASCMIEQLKSVNVVDTDANASDFRLSLYLSMYFKLKSAIATFYKENIMTDVLEDRLDNHSVTRWKKIFLNHHKAIFSKDPANVAVEEIEKAGQETFHAAMGDTFDLHGVKTDNDFSASWYLKVSNYKPFRIVWNYNWFKKFIEKK